MTTTEAKQRSPQLTKMLAEISEVLQPMVDKIEAAPQLTKNHYGSYMALLSKTKSLGDQQYLKCVVLALIECGANKEGVFAAYDIIK